MREIKVSVIIPIYNVEEYLEECLQSVVDQTLEDLQVIMVDDGSLDGSTDIAKKFASRYDHFEYVRQVNGGLGNARNTGVKYAKGKYIIFLDSDDIVPDDAYEKMYLAAEKNHSEMVVGSVARFNSKKDHVSNLHEIAFRKYIDKTHITDNTDLIYDTTSWNKLILKEFWDRNHFEFPERILYEDIPVTIPMHYLANNVTMVQDVCYRWRIRDGANKSITQRADDFTNMRDRITVLRMVDKFFEENVKEQELWDAKYYKWLYIDLMIYVNNCIYLSDNRTLEMMKIIKDYIEETIPLETIDKLPVLYREKYVALMNLDEKRLVKLRQYEVDNYKNLKIVKKGNKYIGKFPKAIVTGDKADMTEALDQWRLTQLIYDVAWQKEQCVIEGYVFLRGLSVPNVNVQKLSAHLVCLSTGEKIPLEIQSIKSQYAQKKFGLKIDNETKQIHLANYKGCGYRIILDAAKIRELKLDGEYHILLTYERDRWKKETILRGILKSLGNKLDKKTYFKDHMLIELSKSYRYDFKVKISQKNIELNDMKLDGDQLRLKLSEKVDALYEAKDAHNAEILKAAITQEDVSVDISDIPENKRYIAVKKGNLFIPVYKEKKKRIFVENQKNQLVEETSGNHRCYLLNRKAVPVIRDVKQNEEQFSFEIINKNIGNWQRATLYVEDPLEEEKIILGTGSVNQHGEEEKVVISLSLMDEKIIKNLYARRRQVFILYENNEQQKVCALGGEHKVFDKKYYTKERRYRFIIDPEDDFLYFTTLRVKEFLTRSAKKRAFVNRFLYPLLRLLPLKKKWIVFESMWGSKFSCNPRYLYEYIDKNHSDYTCIWSLKDECIPITGNGVRVRRLSWKYLYYMARAKYFVNNVNFADSYEKRKGQIEVQTMHGTPLKTIGLDVPGDFPTKKSEKKYIRKCKRWDYLIVQSKFVADLAPSAFKFENTIMDTGYPRTDILYSSNNEEEMSRLKEKLGLPKDKKVIMYAPTWRVRDKFELMLDLEKMKEKFSDEYVLILRLHHFSAKGWKGVPADGFVYDLTDYESIEDLYIITDILITDYSSVMFDYAVLDRPMLFFTYDLDEYRDKLRGFNIDIEKEAPGPLLYTSDEVLDAIEHLDETIENSKQRVDAFHETYIPYECENSSEKVFNMMQGK